MSDLIELDLLNVHYRYDDLVASHSAAMAKLEHCQVTFRSNNYKMLDILNKPEELRMDFLLKGKIKDKGLEHGSIARSILCPSLESHRN